MAKKNGKAPHVSHRQPRLAGKFAKATAPLQTPLTVAAPNAGQPAVPHVSTFQSLIQTISGRRVYLNPDEAVRQSRIEADKMLLDPAVKGPLEERFRSTALAEWHIEPEDKNDAEQSAMAEGLTTIIKKTPHLPDYFNWMLYGVYHGRSAANNIYSWFVDGPERFIGVQRWLPVHGDKLVFSDDGTVGVKVGATIPNWMQNRIDQTVEGRVFWFDEQTRPLYAVHHGEIRDGLYEDVRSAGNLWGVGLRSAIYWPWWLKQNAVGWLLDALERYGQGLTLWFYESGNPESEKAVRAAAEAQSNQNNILFPRPVGESKGGAGIERLELGDGGGIGHIKDVLRDYFDGQIKSLIVGQELSSKAASTGLGSGVANFQQSTKSDIIKMDAVKLGETLTRELVKPLATMNFPRQPCRCSFVFDIDDSERQELLAAAKLFFDMGGEIDADQLRGELGLPKPTLGATILKKSAAPAVPGAAPGGDLPSSDGAPASATDAMRQQAELAGKS